MNKINLLGVPTSAGGHISGMELAPEYLRRNGIVEAIRARGVAVDDRGNLDTNEFSVDPSAPRCRNVSAVKDVVTDVKSNFREIFNDPDPFLAVGGDCTITLGIVAALCEREDDFGILYIDGHTDLNSPDDTSSGILDGMVVAHLFGLGDESLMTISDKRPMISTKNIVFLGYDPVRQNPAETQLQRKLGPVAIPVDVVLAGPIAAFNTASSALEKFAKVIVHVDIDVLQFSKFPLANAPEYDGSGLELANLYVLLKKAFQMKNFAGCVLTEINPDRDKQDILGEQLVEVLSCAIANTPIGHSHEARA